MSRRPLLAAPIAVLAAATVSRAVPGLRLTAPGCSRAVLIVSLAVAIGGVPALAGQARAESLERHGVRIERPEPIPDPDGVDPLLLEDYREREAALDRALADAASSPEALGRACGALGMWLHVYRYFESAGVAYGCAEALMPSDPRWPYHRAALYIREGAVESTRAAFERTLALEPGYLPALIRLADLEVKDGRPEVAERLAQRVLESDPGNPFALTLRGRIAASQERLEAARDLFDLALKRGSAPETHYLLARIHRALGEEAEAVRHLEAARLDPRAAPWAAMPDPMVAELELVGSGAAREMERGRALLEVGRAEEAVPFYRRAVAASPNDVSARINLGGALQRAGDLEGAIEVFEEIVQRPPSSSPHPELAVVHFNLGAVLEESGRIDEAQASYRESLALDPEQLAANFQLARLLVGRGRIAEALPHFDTAIARDPASPGLRFERAVALARVGRYAPAVTAVEADLSALPGQQALMLVLARLLAASPDDAVRDGERALDLAARVTPRNALVSVETFAMALAEVGRFEEAASWQRAALDAIRAQGLAAMEPRVAARLGRYERGEPSREVWLPEEAAAVRIVVAIPAPSP